VVSLTPAAAAALKKLLAEEGAEEMALRISLVGGGCAGYSYDLSFAREPGDDEVALESLGVTLVVDRRALPLLRGLVIGHEGTFCFENPNARVRCGCGASFGV
jgi:iron-sulfur cluster insertion protein